MTGLTRWLGTARIASRPAHWRIVLRDLLHRSEPLRADKDHLRAALDWLARAQDVTPEGRGLSAGYSFRHGWLPAYPETTGYAIPTFLHYAALDGDRWTQRAVRAGDWEIDIQLPDGGVRGGQGLNDAPIVFNTGQVILGWNALYRATGQERYLLASERAAEWLVGIQDRDGSWRQHTYESTPHAYHSRVAWPLLDVAQATGQQRYREAAIGNLRWVIGQARPNGWIDSMAFRRGEDPYTHTIAYTYRGLLECGIRLPDDETGVAALQLARLGADRLLRRFELNKPHPHAEPWPLPAALDARWHPADEESSCVTGNAQIALLWLRWAALEADTPAEALRWTNSALKLLDQVKATQSLRTRHDGIRGGIPGSSPAWGWYLRLTYPNWAAKFFADALMACQEIDP